MGLEPAPLAPREAPWDTGAISMSPGVGGTQLVPTSLMSFKVMGFLSSTTCPRRPKVSCGERAHVRAWHPLPAPLISQTPPLTEKLISSSRTRSPTTWKRWEDGGAHEDDTMSRGVM